MQLLAEGSKESLEKEGFGFIKTECKKFNIEEKVPHVGWNNITHNSSKLFKNIPNDTDFYFVHSYHFDILTDEKSSSLEYGYAFCSSVEKGHIFGIQFHPEKSQKYGLELLKNFGEL
jgi:glutamine amidotransferase